MLAGQKMYVTTEKGLDYIRKWRKLQELLVLKEDTDTKRKREDDAGEIIDLKHRHFSVVT
jgi:DNA-binding PadR family transcriptional regulator